MSAVADEPPSRIASKDDEGTHKVGVLRSRPTQLSGFSGIVTYIGGWRSVSC